MQYQIDLTMYLDQLAQAVSFEVARIAPIELEGLVLEITDGAPEGYLDFGPNGFLIHPVLLLGAMPKFSIGMAALTGVESQELYNPLAWSDAGYPSVASVFTDLISEASRMLMAWSTGVLEEEGFCPLEILQKSLVSGVTFDQAKTQKLFNRGGLRPVKTA